MIITTDDIRNVRPIAENVNDTKRIAPYIEECEMLFIIPIIGAINYKSIERSYLESNDSITITDNSGNTIFINKLELYEGCFYNDNKNHCVGIKKAMGYLVYSRFVRNQNVNVTAFGVVAKQGQFSDAVDEKTIIRIANDAEKIGLNYLNNCIDFINFKSTNKEMLRKKTRNKFKAIGD